MCAKFKERSDACCGFYVIAQNDSHSRHVVTFKKTAWEACENRTSVRHVMWHLISVTLLPAPPTLISTQDMVQCSGTWNTVTCFYSGYSGTYTKGRFFYADIIKEGCQIRSRKLPI
jgi:hypothetical protein